LPLLEHDDKTIAEETRLALVEVGDDEVLSHFIGRYNKDTEDALALGVIRSIYGRRDRLVGAPIKGLSLNQISALAKHLSTASEKKIEPKHITSIRGVGGTLFVQVTFEYSGTDFIVIRAKDGIFKGAKAILSWIT